MNISSYLNNSKRFKWGPELAKINPEKANLLKKYAYGKCLDVGSGSGIYTNYLSQQGFFAVGVDSEKEFVTKSAKKFPHLKFIKGNAYNLPFGNKEFNTLVAFDILEHLDDQKALNEFFRVSQRVIFSVPHKNQKVLEDYGLSHSHYLDNTHKRAYNQSTLKKIARQNNLKIISLNNSLPISVSGLLINRLSRGKLFLKLLLKLILKPFLPEPPLYSTVFGVFEKLKK